MLNSKTLLSLALLAVTTPLAVKASESIVIQFRLHAPSLPEDTSVFITGNAKGLGSWDPAKVPMKYLGQHTWAFDLTTDQANKIEYKYTLGSWLREGASADGRPMSNRVVDARVSSTQSDTIEFWTNRAERVDRGQITGNVVYHQKLSAEGIRPRDVSVWLPPGYAESDQNYPVLYMHDGQNLFDPQTSAFGVDWEVDETCTRLIGEGKLEPLIVVGINNTSDRNREYLPGETGTAYQNFIVKTLKPFIDQNYRTHRARTHTFTGGSSAGGLCAFMLVWEHSDVFSGAICMSPAFRVAGEDGAYRIDYVKSVVNTPRPQAPVVFYIDNGGVGLDGQLQSGVDAMREALVAKGLQPERDFRCFIATEDRHTESAWAKRFPNAVLYLTHER